MKIYIAGPMTGIEDHNYPEFNRVAAILRRAGHDVVNPAENPECGSWVEYMRISLKQVCNVEAIALLDGYLNSKGARLEVLVACELGMQCLPWSEFV